VDVAIGGNRVVGHRLCATCRGRRADRKLGRDEARYFAWRTGLSGDGSVETREWPSSSTIGRSRHATITPARASARMLLREPNNASYANAAGTSVIWRMSDKNKPAALRRSFLIEKAPHNNSPRLLHHLEARPMTLVIKKRSGWLSFYWARFSGQKLAVEVRHVSPRCACP
jgi:hypothetical protein